MKIPMLTAGPRTHESTAMITGLTNITLPREPTLNATPHRLQAKPPKVPSRDAMPHTLYTPNG